MRTSSSGCDAGLARLPHGLRVADDDVAELALEPGRQLVAAVDREGEHVRDLVERAMLGVECPHLGLADERDAERARALHALGREQGERERAQRGGVDSGLLGALDGQVEGRGRHVADRSRCSARSL